MLNEQTLTQLKSLRLDGTYQDEWRSTVDDPVKRARFRAFVNSDAQDENVVFVRERGQIRPAAPEEMPKNETQEA